MDYRHSVFFLSALSALVASGCAGSADGEADGTDDEALVTGSDTYIETNGTWTYCAGPCANTGAAGVIADGNIVQNVTSPTLGGQGHSMKTWVKATGGYANKYFYVGRGPSSGAPKTRITAATYDFYFYLPSAYVGDYQGIEFEAQQQLGTTIWNMAWQYEPSSNAWRIFHYPKDASHGWHASGITMNDFAGDTWYHVTAKFKTTTSSVTHTFFDVKRQNRDGSWTSVVNKTTPSEWQTNATGHADSSATKWNNAVQLDGKPDVYYATYWDDMSLSWSTL